MDNDLRWVIGLFVTIALALAGSIIGTFRHISAKIGALHTRVDEVKEKYVRRDDLDGHLTRMDKAVYELREEMRDNHRQIVDLLQRPVPPTGRRTPSQR